jgi:hypothetical protein
LLSTLKIGWRIGNLSSVLLKPGDFGAARHEAELAVKFGKGAANGAEIVMGEAYGAEGNDPEAIATLESFVRNTP